MAQQDDQLQEGEANLVSRIGPVEVDWPRTIGFYGGLALAVATEMVAPPLALFVAAYPLLKMLNRPKAPRGVQIIAQVLEGAAQPINGDAEGTIRVVSDKPLTQPKPAQPPPAPPPASPAASTDVQPSASAA